MTTATSNWLPREGEEATKMIKRTGLNDDEADIVLENAKRVLGRCVDPNLSPDPEATAELVVGEVQSGKTMSFTALTALAHDNGFPLVLILAGTKVNLRDQTYQRLRRDLQMTGDGGLPTWVPVLLGEDDTTAADIAPKISSWMVHPDWKQATTVAVVLKHAGRLNKAREFVTELTRSCGAFPALIIDDEGDQAGMNLLGRKRDTEGHTRESSTYRAIRLLREALPRHSYILYTATPQAPLLASLADSVSPRTVTVLSSGDNYVGGQDLFQERRGIFDHVIDDNDAALDPERLAPPDSLVQALATFLIALTISQRRGQPKPLSMLIHPSATVDLHANYNKWVQHILKSRIRPALEPGNQELTDAIVERVLKPGYEELSRTNGTTVDTRQVPLEELTRDLPQLLADIQVRVVNRERDGVSADEWGQHTGWILIGGAKLDRGFTVENLAVTYMPRGPGIGNADTIQQRGRFFGYRRSYVDLLRAWLHPDTVHAYREYVEHEQALRTSLQAFDRKGLPLKDWRRQFLLGDDMRPTRAQVIAMDTGRLHLRAGWFLKQDHLYSNRVPLNSVRDNEIRSLMNRAEVDRRDHRPVAAHKHKTLRLPWEEAKRLLADWEAPTRDLDELVALLIKADAVAAIHDVEMVFIDELAPRERSPLGSRSAQQPQDNDVIDPEQLRIGELFQGRGPKYEGDGVFHSLECITIQIHCVRPSRIGEWGGDPVFALAIHLPHSLGSLYAQN